MAARQEPYALSILRVVGMSNSLNLVTSVLGRLHYSAAGIRNTMIATNAMLAAMLRDLYADPTNLVLANQYWKALGSRISGRDVIKTYRTAALHSCEGAVAFAYAYHELFQVSGEGPHLAYFDEELILALENCLHRASAANGYELIRWVLISIGRI